MFRKEFRAQRRFGVGLAACVGALALAAQASAQSEPPGYDQPAIVGGVTVRIPHRYTTDPTTGARVRMDSVTMMVPLDDLDLSTRWGAHVARSRIERAARAVCEQAEDAYPNDAESPAGCYPVALRDALYQAQTAAGYPIMAWGYH